MSTVENQGKMRALLRLIHLNSSENSNQLNINKMAPGRPAFVTLRDYSGRLSLMRAA